MAASGSPYQDAATATTDEELLFTMARPQFKRRRRRGRRRERGSGSGSGRLNGLLNILAALLVVQLALAWAPSADSRPLSVKSSYSFGRGLQSSAASSYKLSRDTHFVGSQYVDGSRRLTREVAPNEEQPSLTKGKGSGSSNNNRTKANKLDQLQQEAAFQRRLAELKQKYKTNRAINDTMYYILLVAYSVLITFGTLSNALICLTVILKPQILSPRNIFIVNLASSDLLLCVFTMPFSFIEISMKMWQMGLIPCKLVAGLQATSIFVSTISITAIALDRYKVIVYPTHTETSGQTAALILGSVWLGALLLSSPLFCFRTVEHLVLPHKYDDIQSIDFCVEDWPFAHGRGIYSVISMIFQYVLPITIVCLVYLKISRKLKKRLIRRQRLTQLECQQKRQLNLIKRTHTMLVSVALVFILSWLPLNLLNLIGDFSDVFKGDDQQFRLVFAVCHLIGCSSACSNPILYGYLNENFRKELHLVYSYHLSSWGRFLRLWLCRLCCCFRGRVGWQSRSGIYAQPTPTSSLQSGSSSDQSSDEDNSSSGGGNSTNSNPSSSSASHGDSQSCQSNDHDDNAKNISEKNDDRPGSEDLGSSRPTTLQASSMGRTMRFCLCISNGAGSSSTETLGPQQQQQQPQQSSRHEGKKSRSITLNGNNDLQDDGAGQRSGREKRFRCKCQCHAVLGQNEKAAEAPTGGGSLRRKSGENNGFVCQEQLRRLSKCSQGGGGAQQRRDSGDRLAGSSVGRRVWLRFWPAATSNEPATQVKQQLDSCTLTRQVASRRSRGPRTRQKGTTGDQVGGTPVRQLDVQEIAGRASEAQLPGERQGQGEEVDKQDKIKRKRVKKEKRRRSANTQLGRHCDSCRETAAKAHHTKKSSQRGANNRPGSQSRVGPKRRPANEPAMNAQVVCASDLDARKRQSSDARDKKGGRIEGLEMGLMLVGPSEPRQFVGSLYLSVASRCSSACSSVVCKRKTTENGVGSSCCSLAPEKSTSYLALESTSFGFSEQPTSEPQDTRGQAPRYSIDVSADNDDNSYSNNGDNITGSSSSNSRRARQRSASSDPVGPSNGPELHDGQVRPVAADSGSQVAPRLPASSSSMACRPATGSGPHLVIDRDRLAATCADVDVDVDTHEDEVKGAAGSQQALVAAQPEKPTSGSATIPAAALVKATATIDNISSSNSTDSDSNSNSNSATSSACHTHSHWQSNWSASCTCSIVSSSAGSSSGQSSCAGQPLPSASPAPLVPLSASATALPLHQRSYASGPVGCPSSLSKEELAAASSEQPKHQEVSSCSSSHLEVELHTDGSSCSSSPRSWASLEVARLMAASSRVGSQTTTTATGKKPPAHTIEAMDVLSPSEKGSPPSPPPSPPPPPPPQANNFPPSAVMSNGFKPMDGCQSSVLHSSKQHHDKQLHLERQLLASERKQASKRQADQER